MNMNTTNNQKNSLASLSNLDLVYVAWLLSDDYFDPTEKAINNASTTHMKES